MKSVFNTAMLLLVVHLGMAQVQLTGTITESKTKLPLEGVAIYFPDLKQGAISDSTGLFKFSQLPKGKFIAAIKYVGYASQTLQITLSKDTSIRIELSETAAELSDVIVTGLSKATALQQSPISISVIGEQELQQTAATNLIDAISKQAGVSQITTGRAISKPVIRGLGYNRVVVLNDGLRQEGQQWGDEHGIEIDEFSISKAEIIKGPGSLAYGSDAIAGVINFLPPEHLNQGTVAGHVALNYQSNGNLLGGSFMNAGNLKGFNWLAQISSKYSGNYSNRYDGKVFNSGFREWNGNGMMGITKKWGYSKITFSSFNQQIGFNEGERDSAGNFLHEIKSGDSVLTVSATGNALKGYGIDVPFQRINHQRVSSQSNIIFKRSNLVLNFSWQLNSRKEFSDVLQPTMPQLYFLLHSVTYDIQYHLPEFKNWSTTFGASGMYQQSTNKGAEFLIPNYSTFDYGIFGVTQRQFGKLLFEGGLRFDQRMLQSSSLYLDANEQPVSASDSSAVLKFASLKKSFFNFSGSVGISYHISPKWIFKLNFAKGFRAPTVAELNVNGVHEGTFRYEYGNVSLKPESNYQVDLGLGFNSEHVNINLSVFENIVQHFIYISKLIGSGGGDSIPDLNDPMPAYQYKQGNAILAGGEFTIDIHPHPLDWLHFESSASYVYAQNLKQPDSAKFLPFIPPAQIRTELRGELPKSGKVFRNAFAEVNFEYHFTQNNVLLENNTETPTSGYPLLGASLGFDLYARNKKKILSFTFMAQNLLDQTYQNHLSRLKYAPVNPATGRAGIWNMGRNFSAKIIVPFEWKAKAGS